MKAADKAALRAAAKADYIAGLNYRELADKYGVGIGSISRWANADGWELEHIRNTFPRKMEHVPIEKPIDDEDLPHEVEEHGEYDMLRASAMKALGKINDLLDLDDALAPRDIKSITAALLDIKNQLNALGPRELREQAARLRALEKQAEQDTQQTAPVTITFVNTEGAEL